MAIRPERHKRPTSSFTPDHRGVLVSKLNAINLLQSRKCKLIDRQVRGPEDKLRRFTKLRRFRRLVE